MALGLDLDAPDQRRRLIVIGAGTALVFVVMFFHWFTAASPYGDLKASAWGSMAVGRLVLAAFLVIAGTFVFRAWTDRLRGGTEVRDAAHVLVVAGAVAALFVLMRLVAPPHFAEVRSTYLGTDATATAAIDYGRTLAVWIALVASATVSWFAYLIARDLPGGFDARHAFNLLRSRSLRRFTSWRRGPASVPGHATPAYGAADAEEKIVEGP